MANHVISRIQWPAFELRHYWFWPNHLVSLGFSCFTWKYGSGDPFPKMWRVLSEGLLRASGMYYVLDKYGLLLTLTQKTWQEVCAPFGLIANTGDSRRTRGGRGVPEITFRSSVQADLGTQHSVSNDLSSFHCVISLGLCNWTSSARFSLLYLVAPCAFDTFLIWRQLSTAQQLHRRKAVKRQISFLSEEMHILEQPSRCSTHLGI